MLGNSYVRRLSETKEMGKFKFVNKLKKEVAFYSFPFILTLNIDYWMQAFLPLGTFFPNFSILV